MNCRKECERKMARYLIKLIGLLAVALNKLSGTVECQLFVREVKLHESNCARILMVFAV